MATHPCNAAAPARRAGYLPGRALLVFWLAWANVAPCLAEEARAATQAPAADRRRLASDTGFLGGLSFTSSRDPISITAAALEFNYRTRVLTYTGDVVVTQGDMKLQSDTLTVGLDDRADNRVKDVIADGQVRLSKGARWATAGHALFDHTQNTVTLSQNAELHDGPNQVTGDRVVVYLNEERSVVEGGNGRVKAVLFPSAATPGTSASVSKPPAKGEAP